MKKLVYLFICASAITFAVSCNKSEKAAEDVEGQGKKGEG